MFDFRRLTLFSWEKRLSKDKITIFSKNFGWDMAPLAPPGYTYAPFCQFYRNVVLRLSEHGDVIETQTIRFVLLKVH